MHARRDPHPGMGGQDGLAEIVVVLVFAAIVGFAFLWALVLHDKPADERTTTTVFDPTATTLVPPTLPPARKYEIDGGVNLREGPATNTPVLTRLEDGAKVRVICKTVGQSITSEDGSTDLWLRIDLGQFGVGYASALYVDTGDDIEDPAIIGDCALAPTG